MTDTMITVVANLAALEQFKKMNAPAGVMVVATDRLITNVAELVLKVWQIADRETDAYFSA